MMDLLCLRIINFVFRYEAQYFKIYGLFRGNQNSKCVVEGENVLNAGHLILAVKIYENFCG